MGQHHNCREIAHFHEPLPDAVQIPLLLSVPLDKEKSKSLFDRQVSPSICVHKELTLPNQQSTQGEMKNIAFIHYYREFGGNMGTKRSEILQGSQFFWFGVLFFSQN